MSNSYETFQGGFYFVDDLAYTEDGIKVHKLYIYKIPNKLKKDQLLQYFERFGRVESLKFLENDGMEHEVKSDSDYEKFNTACVFLANPRDAARVLLTKGHKVNGHRFDLKPSDSWHQPEAYGSSDELPVCLEQSYILQIPDDCLNHIFKFLNLGDQLRFARVCKRFRDVYQTMSRTIYKSFELSKLDGLTIWYVRDFFLLSGRDIENLDFRDKQYNWRICSFIGSNCVNLKSLTIRDNGLSTRNMIPLLANTNKLENLSFVGSNVDDFDLLALALNMKNPKNLKKLSLVRNLHLNGVTFMELPNSIEELDVSYCSFLRPSNLFRFLGSLPNLKDLNLIGIDTSNVYETLVLERKCLKLETLRLAAYQKSNYEKIAKLPNLKFIQIVSDCLSRHIRAEFFDQLVLLKSQQLEQLEIYDAEAMTDQMFMQIAKLSGLKKLLLCDVPVNDNTLQLFTKLNNMEQISLVLCNNITDKGVLRMLLGCPKLKELHLLRCRQITENLVNDIIKNLEGLRNERNLPIHLYIEKEKIRNAIKGNVREDIIKIFDNDIYTYEFTSYMARLELHKIKIQASKQQKQKKENSIKKKLFPRLFLWEPILLKLKTDVSIYSKLTNIKFLDNRF